MLFNSLEFAIFLPFVFILYWSIFRKNITGQNSLVVISSYVFYGWWDWRFLFLLIFSSVVDYCIALVIGNTDDKQKRKLILWISIVVNIGLLGVFKYFNFFAENFDLMFRSFGVELDELTLNIILPVGISFYTFQTLSYTIDVYYKRIEPTRNLIAFLAFVSFFPQLVAGPIERATNLLPQFLSLRKFNYILAVDGIKQMLWGFFMKLVIADNCAIYVNQIFGNSDRHNGSTLFIGALLFTFQIYGDFAGYSNIAIGTSKLFGVRLMQNFSFPYFSRDIAEFWRRWHISLSTWFRDYVYIPLGGSRGSMSLKVRNTFIIFLLSGFWHGAKWTFVFWGLLNALYFLPLLLKEKNRINLKIIGDIQSPRFSEVVGVLFTFLATVAAWIFFRADSLPHAFAIFGEIFSLSMFDVPTILPIDVFIIILAFVLIEWLGRRNNYAIQRIYERNSPLVNWATIYTLILSIYIFGNFSTELEFIYFQF